MATSIEQRIERLTELGKDAPRIPHHTLLNLCKPIQSKQ